MKPAVHNLRLALHAAHGAIRQAYDAAFELDDRIAMARCREIGNDIMSVTSHTVTTHVGQRTTPVQELRQ